MRFKAILFDLGNTLIYFDGAWPQVMKVGTRELVSYLQSHGLELDAELFTNEFRFRLDEYYAQRESEFVEYTTALVLRTLLNDIGYTSLPAGLLQPALKRLYSVSQAYWKPELDTIPTLEKLQRLNYKMAIISNAGDDEDVQTLVNNAGIRRYFDFVLTSAFCGIRKPNPRIFELALQRWGFSHKEVTVVGDTLGADILGARNAGIYSVWITRRADKPANHDHEGTIRPDSTIAALSQLPLLLKELEGKPDFEKLRYK